jgi:hypothetical protein
MVVTKVVPVVPVVPPRNNISWCLKPLFLWMRVLGIQLEEFEALRFHSIPFHSKNPSLCTVIYYHGHKWIYDRKRFTFLLSGIISSFRVNESYAISWGSEVLESLIENLSVSCWAGLPS